MHVIVCDNHGVPTLALSTEPYTSAWGDDDTVRR
jgi:hypothetical protein